MPSSFRPGEKVPASGIYAALHSGHRFSHEVILLRQHEFPRCSHCGTRVSFELISEVPAFQEDRDLTSRRIFEIPHPEQKAKKESA
ncbi:MAG TPA: hypothetical protein VK699_05450 [Terriglobales bacterium]|nr:hypothetical protein [Terriglobales bacterium]